MEGNYTAVTPSVCSSHWILMAHRCCNRDEIKDHNIHEVIPRKLRGIVYMNSQSSIYHPQVQSLLHFYPVCIHKRKEVSGTKVCCLCGNEQILHSLASRFVMLIMTRHLPVYILANLGQTFSQPSYCTCSYYTSKILEGLEYVTVRPTYFDLRCTSYTYMYICLAIV